MDEKKPSTIKISISICLFIILTILYAIISIRHSFDSYERIAATILFLMNGIIVVSVIIDDITDLICWKMKK